MRSTRVPLAISCLLVSLPLTGCLPTSGSGSVDDCLAPDPAPRAANAAPNEPPAKFADWNDWNPQFSDVHEASDDDVADLRRRAQALVREGWSACMLTPLGPAAVAQHGDTTRMTFGTTDHVFATVLTAPHEGAPTRRPPIPGRDIILCSPESESCVRLDGDEDSNGGPHLTDNGHDIAMLVTASVVLRQENAFPSSTGHTPGYSVQAATLSSPSGRLDCITAARSPLTSGARFQDQDHFRSSTCVDRQGAVIVSPAVTGDVLKVSPLIGFSSSTPGDLEKAPAPVIPFEDAQG